MNVDIFGDGDILLVDDDKDFHFIFTRFYKKRSTVENKLVSIYSGEELLEYLGDIGDQTGERPELVLLDVNMPGMLGYECVKKLRDLPYFKEDPRVIMLSSSNYQKDVDRAIEAGANHYLEKPNNLAEMQFSRS